MITGRRSTDWLRDPAAGGGEGDRRGADRRAADRRAPRRRFDPLFAATLINQVAAEETPSSAGYIEPQAAPLPPGAAVNLKT